MFRSKLPVYNGQEIFGTMDVIERNLEFLSKATMLMIAAIAIIYLTVMSIKNYKKDVDFGENFKKCIPYILIFLISFMLS